eukprot:1747968-Lingulodinium_polyedra.AAC.1
MASAAIARGRSCRAHRPSRTSHSCNSPMGYGEEHFPGAASKPCRSPGPEYRAVITLPSRA